MLYDRYANDMMEGIGNGKVWQNRCVVGFFGGLGIHAGIAEGMIRDLHVRQVL